MTEKPKFFFEADNQSEEYSLTSQEHADTFFNTLQSAGIIQTAPLEDLGAKKAEPEGEMKRMENKLLCIEYGTYQENYAIHISPVHAQRNFKDDLAVKRALKELVLVLNEHVPHEVQVKLFLPQPDWKMKVISSVVVDGAKTWNFNYKKLEEEGIPKLFQAIEKVILS
jgi:hypothetical protein